MGILRKIKEMDATTKFMGAVFAIYAGESAFRCHAYNRHLKSIEKEYKAALEKAANAPMPPMK